MLDFAQHIQDVCRSSPRSLALPESGDERTLKAAHLLLKKELVHSILLFGSPDLVRRKAQDIGHPLEKFSRKIHWAAEDSSLPKNFSKWLDQNYKTKSTTPDLEKKQISENPLYQAGYCLKQNQVQAAVAGAEATTADVIRAALKTVGLLTNVDVISGSFLFAKKGHAPFLFADCAVVVTPTSEQLSQIAASTAETWKKLMGSFGPAHVAFLSFSTNGSARHAEVEKIQQATAHFKKAFPGVPCDGELQFDAALHEGIAKRKGIDSGLAGSYNCFVFPDLNSGNISYKITQHLGGYEAYGPILQGLAKPYSDLSRGASVEDIVMTSCLTLLR